MFRVAEFLDPRTYRTLSTQDKKDVFVDLRNLCTYEEKSSERQRAAAAEANQRGRRARSTSTPVWSEEEQLLEMLSGERGLSTVIPIDEELGRFLGVMGIASAAKQLPLLFWTEVHLSFPILWRIARRVLPTPASSTDVERLFSVCGLICTDRRGNLSPEHVNMLASLINTSIHGLKLTMDVQVLAARRAFYLRLDLSQLMPILN